MGGFSKCLVTTAKDGSRYLDFRLSRYPIRGRVDPHAHETAEHVYYVISGTALVGFDGEQRVIAAGDTIFVPPGAIHSVENTGDDDLVFVVVTSPPTDIADA